MRGSIQWSDSLIVNFDKIDDQHKKLILIMNEFHGTLYSKNSARKEKETLVELIDYTKYHFSTEKKLMLENDYPSMDEHLDRHKEFVKKLFELCERRQIQKIEVIREILVFLMDWIVTHIMEDDKKFGLYLRGKEA